MPEINDIKEITEGNFPVNLKLISKYQQLEPILMDKYEDCTYHKGSFRRVSISDLKLITCEDRIIIPSKLQSCMLHWYHTYLLHTVMDITEAMI